MTDPAMNLDADAASRYPALALLERSGRVRRRKRLAWAIGVGSWLYLLGLVTVWLLLRVAGERWWPATLMLFGPRWIYGLPLLVLLPAAVILRRRSLWPLAVAVILVTWPIMGLCLPWGRAVAPDGPSLRVLTCNTDGTASPEAIRQLVDTMQPDVVALQECHGEAGYQWPGDWHVCRQGELLVASPHPIRQVQRQKGTHAGHVWPRTTLLRCTIATPDGDVDFACVHLSSPRHGIAAVLDRSTVVSPSRSGMMVEVTELRRRQSERIAGLLSDSAASAIVVGDFNTPADSALFRQFWAPYRNAFSTSGFGFGHTMRPQVGGWRFGVRIDHILAGADWWPRACWVGPDVGAEHLPVIAELVRAPATD